MASTNQKVFVCIIVIINYFSPVIFPLSHNFRSCKLNKIYQLGDSLSDTGNLIRETIGAHTVFSKLPYGETYFEKATGRCSNGLLMIDFIAWAAGISLLNPYKNVNASFENGANFAVAASTALSVQTLAKENNIALVTNSSLDVQIGWMSTHFASLCKTDTDCIEKLKNSLFIVGEIGGNDYSYALAQGKTIDEVKSMVPNVVQNIINATKRVIQFGAPKIVVPGNFPFGCLPIYLTEFKTNNSAAYDNQHCLKELNDLAVYHNEHLQEAIKELQKESHNTTIVYGDYYNAHKSLLTFAPYSGFDATSLQKACCGTGGDYNFNKKQLCGAPNVSVCLNPAHYISWDGIHFTQEAYKMIATWLIKNILPALNCG